APLEPQLHVEPREIKSALEKFGIEPRALPLLGLNASAEYGPAKRWPLERFVAAAKEVRQRCNCTWILFGGRGDISLATDIASQLTEGPASSSFRNRKRVWNLAGQTSLRELCALLKGCQVLLTND